MANSMKASCVRKCMELPESCFTCDGKKSQLASTVAIFDFGKIGESPNILQPSAPKCSLAVAKSQVVWSSCWRKERTDPWVSCVGHSSPPAGPQFKKPWVMCWPTANSQFTLPSFSKADCHKSQADVPRLLRFETKSKQESM